MIGLGAKSDQGGRAKVIGVEVQRCSGRGCKGDGEIERVGVTATCR